MPEFTTDELHRHIQLTVFGRTRQSHERYNQLQDKLHELVDRPSDFEIVRDFVERVNRKFTGDKLACPDDYAAFVDDELAAMQKQDD